MHHIQRHVDSPLSARLVEGQGHFGEHLPELPEVRLNRTRFQLWMREECGTKPHYLTIQNAIRRGMPVEPHPLIPGRVLFPINRIRAWLEEQRLKPVMASALRASLAK